jgi:diguanylate cyclase (GGDEF)-like protein
MKDVPVRPATPNPLYEQIESALNAKFYQLRFPAQLEKRYETATGAARNRAISVYLIVYLAAKLLLLSADLQIGRQVFRVVMELRLGIILPLTLLAVFLLRLKLPAWVHGIASFTPVVTETALVMILGRLSGSAITDRFVIAAGVGIFAQALLMQAPFRQCVCGFAAALSVFFVLCAAPWPGHFGAPIPLDESIFVIVFCMPALYERYNRERAGRREFLLAEANRLRTEEVMRMNQHLERLSSLDSVTGIFNRRYLDAALDRLCTLAVAKQRWIGVLMIDVDHFKRINDREGHPYGDLCLERVAQILQRSVRAGIDTVARFGGEEFVAILPDADDVESTAVAERIREAIESSGLRAAGTVITVSIGVAALGDPAGGRFTPQELVSAADHALYDAKKSGRNRVVCFVPALQEPDGVAV